MRRKLFCMLVVIMTLIFLADFAGVSLRTSSIEGLVGQRGNFTGKITKIQYKDDEKYNFEIMLCSVNGRPFKCREKILLTYYGILDEPWNFYNETINFHGEINEPTGQRNPHCFNYKKYLKSRGIGAVAAAESFTIQQQELSLKDKYEKWLFCKRCLFERELSDKTKGIIVGVLFGDTSFMDEDVYEDFRNNGTAHILAVSGLHVGILYGIYKKTLGRNNSRSGLVILVIMLFTYGTLSMWSPSVTRASLMIGMSVMARLLDLRYDMLTSMSAVAMILILINPYVVFGAGFQMSFLAIISIAFMSPKIPDKIPDFLTAPISVNLGLIPYQIYQFNYISLVSLAANLPVVFLAGYFVPIAVLAFAAFIITGSFNLLRPAVDGMAMMITEINRFSALGGHGSIEVASPPLCMMLLVEGTLFYFTSEAFSIMKLRRNFRKIFISVTAIVLLSAACGLFNYSPLTYDDIVFVDVGQGDCIHLKDGRTDILIDGGGNIRFNVGKETLKPYLLKNGAQNVDMAIATHLHMDHYKGLEELSEVFDVKTIRSGLTSGQNIKVSENLTIETIWPETIDLKTGQEENSQCSVFLVNFYEYKILVTGDLDAEGENSIINKYKGTDKLKSDILKIGHHGSKYSTSQEFLDIVDPTYAVIQVGRNNYGHPAAEVIEKCQKKGIIVLRNDYNGAVGFSFGKRGIRCHMMIDRKD